ncbi:glutathione peroxidase [Rufibacter sp. LB8]|uniref:glutathione peroxidase n=1 Tax=Rufibacter sp. LB8 TaxID=2777781 RepID=UPI00178C5592|nr:glutathione peroxidase [Rufibacter sp. LB8]
MQKFLTYLSCSVLLACSSPGGTVTDTTPNSTTMENTSTTAASSIYDIALVTNDGQKTTLSKYKGKKILIVNVASECGYTPQYEDLEKLQKQYAHKVAVLGFPANDFGGQEPGSDQQIAAFCQKNFGVTFPLFQKAPVSGTEAQPLFKWLASKEQNGKNEQAPNWNFCKYLISEDGTFVKFYPSKVAPLSDELLKDINL